MDAILAALVSQLLLPLVLFLAASLGGWLMTKLPGPLRDWLKSGTHERDLDLLLGAVSRYAFGQVSAGVRVPSVAAATAYLADNLPETYAKLKPSQQALEAWTAGAWKRATTELSAGALLGGRP